MIGKSGVAESLSRLEDTGPDQIRTLRDFCARPLLESSGVLEERIGRFLHWIRRCAVGNLRTHLQYLNFFSVFKLQSSVFSLLGFNPKASVEDVKI